MAKYSVEQIFIPIGEANFFVPNKNFITVIETNENKQKKNFSKGIIFLSLSNISYN